MSLFLLFLDFTFWSAVMNGLQRQIHNMEHTVKDTSYEMHLLLLRFYNFLIVTATAQRQKSYQENYYSHFNSFQYFSTRKRLFTFLLITISKSSMNIYLRTYVKIGYSASSLLIFIPLFAFSYITYHPSSRSCCFLLFIHLYNFLSFPTLYPTLPSSPNHLLIFLHTKGFELLLGCW